MKVTIVVVTYNSAALLPAFFASLPDAAADLAYELVVADNASTDASVDLARAAGATVVELERNVGYSAGINAAVGVAQPSDAIYVLNPDIRLAADSIRPLVDALELPNTAISVPRMLNPDGTVAWSLRREPSPLRVAGEAILGGNRSGRFAALGEQVVGVQRYTDATTADWATGAAMCISRSAWDVLGPWDESFFLYAEETEYALRAKDAGLVLRYVPDASVTHIGGEMATDPALWSLCVVNKLRLYRRRHGRARSFAFHAALVLNEALRAPSRPASRAGLAALLLRSRRR
ncbi:MAG: N-acetylglucosaminyl-diphospho-decaprenol L-rhamnosyltransferase [Acidimicrobiaceae bacterium]